MLKWEHHNRHRNSNEVTMACFKVGIFLEGVWHADVDKLLNSYNRFPNEMPRDPAIKMINIRFVNRVRLINVLDGNFLKMYFQCYLLFLVQTKFLCN